MYSAKIKSLKKITIKIFIKKNLFLLILVSFLAGCFLQAVKLIENPVIYRFFNIERLYASCKICNLKLELEDRLELDSRMLIKHYYKCQGFA